MGMNFETLDFKEAVEWILEDWGKLPPSSIHRELNELIFCLDIDGLLVHEDAWDKIIGGEKPENDIELCGEHFFVDWR